MTTQTEQNEVLETWQRLAEIETTGDSEKVSEYIDSLSAEEQRLCFSRLSNAEQSNLIEALPSAVAADVIEHLPETQSSEIFETISPEAAAGIVEKLPNNIGADLLQDMPESGSEAVLAVVHDETEAQQLRDLSTYKWDTAGGLMTDAFLSVSAEATTGEVIQQLTAYAEIHDDVEIQYVYVVDEKGGLAGVLRLRDLVLKKSSTPVQSIMLPDPASVEANDDFETLRNIFDGHSYLALPVLTESGVMVGVITRKEVREATSDHQTEEYLHSSGIVGGEELRSMPMLTRSRRRLAWLAPNIVLNLIAASIIALYQDTLQAVIALAVFLPIISDMSGCSGNQAVAVSIRELTLGVIRPTEFLRIVWKEGILGLINGAVLGLLLGTIAFIWKDNITLGCVVGGALFLNTMLSVLLGGMVPLFLKRLKVDPALASGPILTTCTDMCGFFLVLSLASSVLDKLT